MVEWLPDRIGDYDPYNFFSHLAGPILLRCTSEFEIASSRLALGVRPFFVTGVLDQVREEKYIQPSHRAAPVSGLEPGEVLPACCGNS